MFKVPLSIFGGDIKQKEYTNYTNHYHIGRSIIEYAKGNQSSNPLTNSRESFIFFDAGENIFSILKEDLYITLKDDEIFYSKTHWPGTDSKSCTKETCEQYFQSFHNHFIKMKGLYEK